MALDQVYQISFKNEVCAVKLRHFYNKIVNESDIVEDMKLLFGQLITLDKMKPV